MKKIIILFLISMIACSNAFSYEMGKKPFKKLITKNFVGSDFKEEQEVRKFLNKMNKYSNEHNLQALKEMYDPNYKSMDGFDYDTFFKMVEETFNSYSDIKYKTTIKNVMVLGDWAMVRVSDVTKATLDDEDGEFVNVGTGELLGVCKYVLYLKKSGEEWKIISDRVDFEETSLKYGDAKTMDIKFQSPLIVKPNKDYTISLETDCPRDVFALSSLNSEEIIYPPVQPQESYRKMPETGPLERIIRSNKNGSNEYAVASVGLTKLFFKGDGKDLNSVSFKMTGMAFIMRRVNVLNQKDNADLIRKVKKDAKGL